jgi:DNA-binding GntR family transcriptional regulator
VDELTKELGMSPTPIREALRLLQADELVTYRPHHGVVVADVSTEQVDEICNLRSVLEPIATRQAVTLMTPEVLAELERQHAIFVSKGNSRERRGRADADWHWTIYDASGSRFLEGFIRRLWDAFPWRAAHVHPDNVRESVQQHELVMDAIRQSDSEAAANLMHDHIELFRIAFIAALNRAA